MRLSPDPANLTYIAFRRKNTDTVKFIKNLLPWLLNKSGKSCEYVSIIAGPHPSKAPMEDITVLVERTLRAEGKSAP